MLWQHRGEGRVSAIALGRYLKLVDPALAAQTDTPLLANDAEMSISSKTSSPERAPKSATGSRACQAAAPVREAIRHSNIQPGIQPGILDQLQDAIFTTDLNGIITSCNRGINRYGFEAKELVGKNIAAFYAFECGVEQQTFLASRAIASVLEKGRFEGELRCRTKSGQDVDVHLCLTLLRDSNAAGAGILGFSIERTGERTGEIGEIKEERAPVGSGSI